MTVFTKWRRIIMSPLACSGWRSLFRISSYSRAHHQANAWSMRKRRMSPSSLALSPILNGTMWSRLSSTAEEDERSAERELLLSGTEDSQMISSILSHKAILRLLEIHTRRSRLIQRLSEEQLDPSERRQSEKDASYLNSIASAIEKLQSLRESEKSLLTLLRELEREVAQEESDNSDSSWNDEARAELKECQQRIGMQESAILNRLVRRELEWFRPAIVEVRAGAGGDEASLFAAELLDMYIAFAGEQGWSAETLSWSGNEAGGLKEGVVLIKSHAIEPDASDGSEEQVALKEEVLSQGAYGHLRFESGVHRVQRIPTTEAGGRLHTSTATVAVFPEMQPMDLKGVAEEKDIRIDVYRASGAGGQHVNTTESAVRLTHIPSGLVVTCQDERSQHKNKARAMKILQSRLYDAEMKRRQQERNQERSSQLGTGDRNERIRTYQFQQGRITDHRIGLSVHDIDRMMQGLLLEDFTCALYEHEMKEKIEVEVGKL